MYIMDAYKFDRRVVNENHFISIDLGTDLQIAITEVHCSFVSLLGQTLIFLIR